MLRFLTHFFGQLRFIGPSFRLGCVRVSMVAWFPKNRLCRDKVSLPGIGVPGNRGAVRRLVTLDRACPRHILK